MCASLHEVTQNWKTKPKVLQQNHFPSEQGVTAVAPSFILHADIRELEPIATEIGPAEGSTLGKLLLHHTFNTKRQKPTNTPSNMTSHAWSLLGGNTEHMEKPCTDSWEHAHKPSDRQPKEPWKSWTLIFIHHSVSVHPLVLNYL